MADILETGQRWLSEQLQKHASREVLYLRGDDQLTVKATVGRTLLKLDDGYGGVRMEWTDRDYLVKATELVLHNGAFIPERGDRIRELAAVYDDGFYLYLMHEVMAPGSEPPWRWSDPHRHLIRIHTKFVDTKKVHTPPEVAWPY